MSCMNCCRTCSLFRWRKKAVVNLPGSEEDGLEGTSPALKVIGWTSVAVGVAALGIYVGREIRIRYKFKRRTPYDFYSHADDASAEFGMGI
jgi:hypothetical protein